MCLVDMIILFIFRVVSRLVRCWVLYILILNSILKKFGVWCSVCILVILLWFLFMVWVICVSVFGLLCSIVWMCVMEMVFFFVFVV